MTRKVVSPIALDKSINTTEQTPRNIADVLAQQLAAIKTAIESGNGNLEAAFVCYYGVTTATQIKEAIEDGKVPYFYYNGAVAQLWKVETDKYTFRTTNTRSVEGQTILDVVDYVVNGSVWSTITREVSGCSSSGQSYIASVNSLADFDTTGKSGMQDLISVANVPADGVYQVSVMLHITPKTASATKSDLVLQFTSSDNTGWPSHTFHAVVDDSQTFAQQLSFSTSVSLKAGQNTLRIQCGDLNTEYLVFVDELTLAQLVNGVYHNGDNFDEVYTLPEAADFNNDDGVLVDGATGGPRFMLWRTLANKVLGFIKSLSTTITAFRTGDVIPVDGPSGTAKMSKDDLLKETAENAVGISVAPNFDETINYKQMDIVSYDGNLYVFVENHNAGAWNAVHVCRTKLNEQIKKGGITSYHIKGNNAALKTEICLVCEQSWIELDIDTSDWTINNDTNTSHILFSVKALSRNSAPRVILEKTIGDGVASLPSKLVFDTKNGEQALYFIIRCDKTKYASFEIKDFTNEIVKGSVVDKSIFEQGNIAMSASTLTYSGSVSRVRTRPKCPIKMRTGDVIFCKTGFAFYIAYSSDGVNPYTTLGWTNQFIAPSDCYVHIVARKGPEVSAGVDDIIPSFYSSSAYSETNPSNKVIRFNEIVNAVNHRGYNTCAPENTLPAFKLSAKAGFRIVETDVRETADGELVCIHDASVDRTSNGSGDVADMTLAQLKALDFGSWKNALYTGTTIPTLQEFLVCCRNLGLKAYIEIKVNDIVDKLLSIVKGYGMENNVTYISPIAEQLEYLVSKSPKSRIGLVRETFGSEVVTWANNLKSFYGAENVFIDAAYINLTSTKIGYLKDAGIPLEVWTVEYNHILNAEGYISGFTSNEANASILLYNQNIN